MRDDFESPLPSIERTITVGGKSATYKFTEPSSAEVEALFDVSGADGLIDRAKARGIRFRVIAAVVSRMDGRPITAEEAGKMRNEVVVALHKEAMDVLGYNDDGKDAGNV